MVVSPQNAFIILRDAKWDTTRIIAIMNGQRLEMYIKFDYLPTYKEHDSENHRVLLTWDTDPLFADVIIEILPIETGTWFES